jgi:hypothetical protein
VPEESIWLELKRIVKNSQQHHKQPQSGAAERKFYTKVGDAAGERHLIQLLLDNDPLPDCIDAVVIDQMKHPLFKKILELIVDLKKNGRWNGPNSLIALLNEKELLTAFSSLAAEEIPHGLDKTKVIGDCIYDIQKRDKENRIKGLIVKMEESEKQKQDVSGLMQEIHNLQKELTQLNKLKI